MRVASMLSGVTLGALLLPAATVLAKSCPDLKCVEKTRRLAELKAGLCSAVGDRQEALTSIRNEWAYAHKAGVVDLDDLSEYKGQLREAESDFGDADSEWRSLTGKHFDPKLCIPQKPLPVASRLPPDPPPPMAKHAADLPKWRRELTAGETSQELWEPGADKRRQILFSALSQVLARGSFWGKALDEVNQYPELKTMAIAAYMIIVRTGRLPDALDARLRAYIVSLKDQPHLGVWASGEDGFDFSALAAWLNPESLDYFREFLDARGGTEDGAFDDDPDPAWLRYLADGRFAAARYQTLLLMASKRGRVATVQDCDLIGLVPSEPNEHGGLACR